MLQESGWWHGKSRALVNPEQSSSYLLIWLPFLNGRQLHQLTSVACSMSALLPVSHNSISHKRWASSNSQPNPDHPSGCHLPTSPVIQPGNKFYKRRRSEYCTSQAQEGHKYHCPLSSEEIPHESCCELHQPSRPAWSLSQPLADLGKLLRSVLSFQVHA